MTVPALLLALISCTDATTGGTTDTAPLRTPGADATVVAFDGEHVYYGDENRRTVDLPVSLPGASSTYTSILGRFQLSCPDDGCDHWDRYGTFGIVVDPGTDDEQYIELDRFITAYRVGFSWDADLTDVRPLLSGDVTLRVFIDTWVGPGHSDGAGWLFDAELDFVGGEPPSPEPVEVIPVWPHQSFHAGLADNPPEAQVAPVDVGVTDAAQVTLRSFITGHGWNNSQNCAEFCAKDHTYTVGSESWTREVWRDDCEDTVTDGTQAGTWTYDRAGWCPGDQVFPWDMDASDAWTGDRVTVGYALQDYTWSGDGDQPYYYLSGNLIRYE